ncbi:MAG: hypothetical protein ACLUDU_05020 [Butyricimonas faecihominis]
MRTIVFNVQADYRNVLNISNWPQGIREGVSLFSDLGHGMDLPLFRIVSEWQEVFRSHVYGIQLCCGFIPAGFASGC